MGESLISPENFKRPILAKMNKLSNKGWSFHLRLLKMDQHALSYYRNVPKDFDENTQSCPSVENGNLKPKASIPLKRIISVSEIQEDDKKKFKKLTKAPDIAFKIVFSKKHIVKKEYVPGQDESQNESDDEEVDDDEKMDSKNGARTTMQQQSSKGARSKSKGKKDNNKAASLDTWYLVCDTKKEQEFWIDQLVLSGRQLNPNFDIDEDLNQKISQRTSRLLNPNTHNSRINAQQLIDLYEDDDDQDQQQQFGKMNRNRNDDDDFDMSNDEHSKKNIKAKKLPQQDKQPPGNRGGKDLDNSNRRGKDKSATHIDLFKQNQRPGHSRQGSNFTDLDQVLKQNLNINNVNLDADGNVNDANGNMRINEDDDGDQYYEDNQDAKERVTKLKNNINRIFNASQRLQEKKTKKELKGWDLKFQNYWGYLVSADKNLKDSMTLSERFFDHIGNFRRSAQSIVKEIVDELHKPHKLRNYQPIQKYADEHGVFLDDEDMMHGGIKTLFYYVKNICIKITHQGDQVIDTTPFLQNSGAQGANFSGNRTQAANNSGIDNSYMTSAQQQNKNSDPFQNMKWKLYGREFLSLDVTFDTLYLLSKPDATHKLRVPLSAQVDYKGFRAIAVASIPIQPQLGPSIGFYTDGKYVPHDLKLKQELVYVGDVLNLKENRINQKGQGTQFESVPVSFFVKVYNYQQPESKNKGLDPDTPTKKSQEFHFTELQYLEEPYYVLKTAEIFPFDCDQSEHPRKDRYLRPEFVCTYERPLKADARKDLGFHVAKDTKSKDDDNDQVDLNEATRYLRSTVIPNLVNLLNSLIIMPIDSESLELTFHSQGVNMRYLGMVTSLTNVPHVIDICITEMLARACKNILNKQIAAMILDHQKRFNENIDKLDALKLQNQNRNKQSNSTLLGSNNQNKRQNQLQMQSQQEYDQKERELLEEQQDLSRNMDDLVKMAIIDYLNLVFGAGDETVDFWNSVLLPYVSQYYNYPMEELQKRQRQLNALFFSFTWHFGIKIGKAQKNFEATNERTGKNDKFHQNQQQKDDDYFKEFEKSEIPFGLPERAYTRVQIFGRSRTYGLRNLAYKLLAEKYRDYRAEGKIESALKCCKMKRLMRRLLESGEGGRADDVATIADICEIALDNGEYKIAKEQAIEGLKNIQSPLHGEAIKFYCILMRAFYGMDFAQEADQYFSKALATLDHHWGPYHPLHSTIYGIMAHLLIQKGKLDEARYLYDSSLICSLRVLGPNHIQTAEIHIDFGRLLLRMKNKDESLQEFEKAFLIYESYFGPNALPTANAAMQIATILEEQQGKLNDAFHYVEIATKAFRDIYGDESEHTIFAQFLTLGISYALKHNTVRKQCDMLFEQLVKRDRQAEIQAAEGQQIVQQSQKTSAEFEDRILKIKELCVATFLLEMTRSLKPEEKQAVKSYCDKVLFRAHQQKSGAVSGGGMGSLDDDDNLPNLADLHQRIDQMKISSLSNLKFDDSGKRFLQQLYEELSTNSFHNFSFSSYYSKVLEGVISQVKEEQKKQQNQAQTAKPNAKIGMEQNNLFDNWLVTDEPKEFFKRVIKCFEHVNFYNLLIL